MLRQITEPCQRCLAARGVSTAAAEPKFGGPGSPRHILARIDCRNLEGVLRGIEHAVHCSCRTDDTGEHLGVIVWAARAAHTVPCPGRAAKLSKFVFECDILSTFCDPRSLHLSSKNHRGSAPAAMPGYGPHCVRAAVWSRRVRTGHTLQRLRTYRSSSRRPFVLWYGEPRGSQWARRPRRQGFSP